MQAPQRLARADVACSYVPASAARRFEFVTCRGVPAGRARAVHALGACGIPPARKRPVLCLQRLASMALPSIVYCDLQGAKLCRCWRSATVRDPPAFESVWVVVIKRFDRPLLLSGCRGIACTTHTAGASSLPLLCWSSVHSLAGEVHSSVSSVYIDLVFKAVFVYSSPCATTRTTSTTRTRATTSGP